jgi:aromatic-L-amino-acid/L-tryptophan decarboxylase
VDIDARYPLEPSAEEMRVMGAAATDLLSSFITGLPDSPAVSLDEIEAAVSRASGPFAEAGRPFDELLDVVAEGSRTAFNTTGPGYLAYIPGGGLYSAAVADFLACGLNRFVNLWNAAPVFARIEYDVVRWLCDLFGYPPEARGILTSGGSMANFSAIVTARKALLPPDFLAGTLYVSDQTHASVAKAAILAGFPQANVRAVPCTPDLAVDVAALQDMIGADRLAGMLPFFVVANAGTTNTGKVDAIAELVCIAHAEGMWLHVDGAYGGFFQLTQRGRDMFRGIEGADSITLDPHKGMFLPYGTGSLLVREGRRLRDAHMVGAEYLQDLAPETDTPNFADYSPELSRDFRGLRVWLPLMLHGVGPFREALDEKLDLARWLHEELRTTPGFDLRWGADLTVVPFRYNPRSGDPEDFNRRLLERINDSKRVFLSSTMIHGQFVLRACILSFRTHRDRVEEAATIIKQAAAGPV